MTLRIAVDFNTMLMDPEERVVLNTAGNPQLETSLKPGLTVIIYDESLEVGAVAELVEPTGRWLARPDWRTSRDLVPEGAAGLARLTADD